MNPSLGDLGLTDSIQDLVENMNATKKAHVCFQYNDINEKRLSENQKLTLFRIAQEALNNVMKHAEARQIMIKLSDQKIQYNY